MQIGPCFLAVRQSSKIMTGFRVFAVSFLLISTDFTLSQIYEHGCEPDDHCLVNELCISLGFKFGHCTEASAAFGAMCPAYFKGKCTYCPEVCNCEFSFTQTGNLILSGDDSPNRSKAGAKSKSSYCRCCHTISINNRNVW